MAAMPIAMCFTRPGPPDVLRPCVLDVPAPGAGEVRVRVRAAGVQPADVAVRATGWAPPGVTLPSPVVPGNELAGVVDAVGAGVTAFAAGDEVLGFRTLGCYAEQALVPADQLVRKPARVPWEAAGALSASGQTADTALEALAVARGDTLLLHGAAGGVGTIAVQLAMRAGATVVATASRRNHAYLRSLGPEGTILPVEHGPGLVERVRAAVPRGVDVALDAAGRGAVEASVELVADRARIGTLVDFAAPDRLGARALRSQRSAARLSWLVAMVDEGGLRVHVEESFPLERAADAHALVEEGHVRGKIVLTAG